MQNEQKKSLTVNIITGALVVGVMVVGYFMFTNQVQSPISTNQPTLVGKIASETVLIGSDIESTVKDLENLKRAVEGATIIFSTPAFQNLQDYSVAIPPQPVGRPNPFVLTSWKQKIKELEKAPATQSSSKSQTPSSSVLPNGSSVNNMTGI